MTAPSLRALPRASCRGDAGSAYATVLVFPLVILIFMTFVQWGLHYHAEALVNAAAQDGARAAQTETGTRADGNAAITAALGNATANGLLTNVQTTVAVTGTQVTVTITGEVPSLVPLSLDRTVHASVAGPKEHVTQGAAP